MKGSRAMAAGKIAMKAALVAGMFCAGLAAAVAGSGQVLDLGPFSKAAPGGAFPEGWEPLNFPKIKERTQYALVEDAGRVAVRADSRASSSGMIRKMEIDPNQYPVIRWSWKITKVLAKGDVTRKSGDDYPARIYVSFKYDPSRLSLWDRAKYKAAKILYGEYPPLAAINYIWASNAPKGTVAPNPYSDRVMMIAVESGKEKAGAWVAEERNILEDYQRVFGEEAPLIAGVAIMTDTDNTGDSAVSFYGDVAFSGQ